MISDRMHIHNSQHEIASSLGIVMPYVTWVLILFMFQHVDMCYLSSTDHVKWDSNLFTAVNPVLFNEVYDCLM